jgi:hypothetical protein
MGGGGREGECTRGGVRGSGAHGMPVVAEGGRGLLGRGRCEERPLLRDSTGTHKGNVLAEGVGSVRGWSTSNRLRMGVVRAQRQLV